MLRELQRVATQPQFIRLSSIIIILILLIAGIGRTALAQGEVPSIPEFDGTIIDDISPDFSLEGPNRYWHEADFGYLDHLWWTKNNDAGRENIGRWNLGIAKEGTYQIVVYIPPEHATTHQARYSLHHVDQVTEIRVDQGSNQNTWYSLGEFEFDGTGKEYLELSDETGEADSQHEVAFDAVGYSPQDHGLEEVVADALWDKVKIWLDEQATDLKAHLDEWLEKQKGQFLRQLGNSLTSWIDEQCTGLGAAMVLPGFALIMWWKKRKDT